MHIFLYIIGAIAGILMFKYGWTGCWDMVLPLEKSNSIAVETFRLFDIFYLSGIFWFCQKVYENWGSRPEARKNILLSLLFMFMFISCIGFGVYIQIKPMI